MLLIERLNFTGSTGEFERMLANLKRRFCRPIINDLGMEHDRSC